MMYDPIMIQPMRDELVQAGFKEVGTPEEVDSFLLRPGDTSLMVINSVCGCAAGVARPGIIASLKNDTLPKNLLTAFAGNDVDAVTRARELCVGYTPSSPSAALFRDGELVFMLQRHQIEGQTAENIAKVLGSAFKKYCGEEVDETVEIFDPASDMQISASEAEALRREDAQTVFLDVREPGEIAAGKIEGSLAADNALGQEIMTNWSRDKQIVVYCQHGQRSLQAVQFLRGHGFEKSWSLAGGYAEWSSSNTH